MIVTLERVKKIPQLKSFDDEDLTELLNGIEGLIRSYTNNNFQNRNIRFYGDSSGNTITGKSPFLRSGDTVQVSESQVNDGLYTVIKVNADGITLDRELFNIPLNLVTKIEYPDDVRRGVINLLKWEAENRDKVGIKSEHLSRYSVTYYDQDSNNQVNGYPVSLLGFLKPYMKARF